MGGGRFDDQVEAATLYAKRRKLTLDDCRLKGAVLPRVPLTRQQSEHWEMMMLYHGKYPGDACNVDKFAQSTRMWKCFELHCGMIPSFLIAKATTDRDDVLTATMEIHAKIATRANKPEEEAILYDVMVLAAHKISRHRWPKAWQRCVGRGNFHWMNFHSHLTKIGVLSLEPPNARAKGLAFQNSGTLYYVMPLNVRIKKNLKTQILFGEGCLRQLANVPSTGPEYVKVFHDIDSKSGKLVGASDGTSYTRKWMKRGFLRLLMQSYGVALKTEGLSVRQFIKCFPDEHKRLQPLLSDTGLSEHQNMGRSVVDAMKALRYTDDPELLSMHACLFSCFSAQVVLRSKPAGWTTRNLKALREHMDKYMKQHGIWPHPAVLLEECYVLP